MSSGLHLLDHARRERLVGDSALAHVGGLVGEQQHAVLIEGLEPLWSRALPVREVLGILEDRRAVVVARHGPELVGRVRDERIGVDPVDVDVAKAVVVHRARFAQLAEVAVGVALDRGCSGSASADWLSRAT
jgi:hypothetical protein